MMSGHYVYEHAPLGSLIRFTEGKFAASSGEASPSQGQCGEGLLVRKNPAVKQTNVGLPASITLRMTQGEQARSEATFSIETPIEFEVIKRPSMGIFRLLRTIENDIELLGLFDNLAEAQAQQSRCGLSGTYIDQVPTDKYAADVVEGRQALQRNSGKPPVSRLK